MNVSAEATTAIEEWSIVLDDNIGANFYLNVPADVADNAQVKVTVDGQTETYALSGPNTKGLYLVSVDVAAAQMTEDITLQLVAAGTEYAPVSYSIQDYAKAILAGKYTVWWPVFWWVLIASASLACRDLGLTIWSR